MVVIYIIGGHPGLHHIPLEKVGEGNLGCLGCGVNHFAALVIAAMGTRLVRQLLLVAIGALGQGQRVQMVMGAARARARFE